MPILEPLLYGVLVPVVVSGVVLAVGLRPRRAGATDGGRWIGALAHGGGYAAGYALLFDWPALPPCEDWQWLAHVALIAVAAGLVDAQPGAPAAVRWGVRLLVSGLTAWLLVPIWVEARVFWMLGLGAAVITLWAVLRRLAAHASAVCVSLALLAALVGAGGVLVLTGNARFGQLAGALAATFGARLVVGFFNRPVCEDVGSLAVVAVLLPGLMFNGHFNNYGDVPAAIFVLVALAPVAAWVAGIGPLRRLTGWPETLVRVGGVVLVTGAALAVAVADYE